ncbi:HAD hydrolase family protein [Halomonas sp. M20]|uniref:HAD hydrolase family protein n=1 Tax=Halomonas sp. M20 TaxID=2763264 RepID=UPI001D0BB740
MASNPGISADNDRASALQPLIATGRVPRMIRRVDLHTGADLCPVADSNGADVEQHTAVVQEHAIADEKVVSIVDEKWRSDDATGTKTA